MVHAPRLIKTFAVFFLLATPVQAQEPSIPLDFSGHYDFGFSGIPFGRLDIMFKQSATRYSATADVKTTGIVRVFVQHKSHTTSQGSGTGFSYGKVAYESSYSTRGKQRYAAFNKEGGRIVSEKVLPPDNRGTRSAVPAEAKNGALDPLAIGLAIRSEFIRAQKDGRRNFSLDFYDGRRLTRADFTVGDERNIRIGGTAYPVYSITARRKPLGGYTASELARFNAKEADLTIYFSHDEKCVPIYLEAPVAFGVATATLRM